MLQAISGCQDSGEREKSESKTTILKHTSAKYQLLFSAAHALHLCFQAKAFQLGQASDEANGISHPPTSPVCWVLVDASTATGRRPPILFPNCEAILVFVCRYMYHAVSCQSFDDSLQTMRGSIPWMAPEMIKQTGHGRSADVWSLGATMIEMYTARYPWPPFTNNMAAMYHVATATEVGSVVQIVGPQ